MSRNYVGWVLLIGLMGMFMACAGTPPAEETAPVDTPAQETTTTTTTTVQPTPPDQVSLNALDAAAARAAAARKTAMDFHAPSLLPSEWQSADSLYSQAERERNTSSLKDAQDSAARYNTAADAFEAMRDKTIAQYYDSKLRELLEARNAAIEAGAAVLIPDFLSDADDAADNAQANYEAKDYYAAKDDADNAIMMYSAMKAGLEANEIREGILDLGLEAFDPSNFSLAEAALEKAITDYSNKNYPGARDNAESALSHFTLAMQAIVEAYGEASGAEAYNARQKALEAKANVAVKQDFDAAETVFVQGNSAIKVRKYDEAAGHFARCTPMFLRAAEDAIRKRQVAEEALRRADQKVAESEETAKSAELILEGGEL